MQKGEYSHLIGIISMHDNNSKLRYVLKKRYLSLNLIKGVEIIEIVDYHGK